MKKQSILQSIEAATGRVLSYNFHLTSLEEIEGVMLNSEKSFLEYQSVSLSKRRNFMHTIAAELENLGEELYTIACQETGLPLARIQSETERTCNQLRSYADAAFKGDWLGASIDNTDLNKPDLRKMLIPIGPVIVFGASNFPLAYSTAGGDTASALAAGCSVVVKAHPAHPGTCLVVGEAITKAIKKCGVPQHVFQQVFDTGFEIGQALVKHPLSKAIAFTGSHRGGRALFNLAAARPEPIPVFAEMGSVNPVVLLPDELLHRSVKWAKQYSKSITLNMGQYCTNPGMLIGIASEGLELFKKQLIQELQAKPKEFMLNAGICKTYYQGINHWREDEKVIIHSKELDEDRILGVPVLAEVEAKYFLQNADLSEEIFGPFSLLISCKNKNELNRVIMTLKGQLTTTCIASREDLQHYSDLLGVMQQYAGRIIMNGVPTGVEVCPSQHHGGPYPATTDSRFTAVGEDALQRFARPITYQNFDNEFLPAPLRDDNPLSITRRINGVIIKEVMKKH